MEFLRKNFIIVIAFALPIILIIAVALSAYLPSLFLSTQYNFIYMSCADTAGHYSYYRVCENHLKKSYPVIDGKLVVHETDPSTVFNEEKVDKNFTVHIFLHDTEKNESREITLEQARALTLNNLLTSPDGVTISGKYADSAGGPLFLFGGGSQSYNQYLTKGRSHKKLNLINTPNNHYYLENFHFIGWVVPDKN
ncbi:MAG: hypothetical protein KC736_03300 [Candidatus Moranbacteria bacterium]|nr:hypothetical protein [Candidatus Moranbacteria bacterium]